MSTITVASLVALLKETDKVKKQLMESEGDFRQQAVRLILNGGRFLLCKDGKICDYKSGDLSGVFDRKKSNEKFLAVMRKEAEKDKKEYGMSFIPKTRKEKGKEVKYTAFEPTKHPQLKQIVNVKNGVMKAVEKGHSVESIRSSGGNDLTNMGKMNPEEYETFLKDKKSRKKKGSVRTVSERINGIEGTILNLINACKDVKEVEKVRIMLSNCTMKALSIEQGMQTKK